MLKIKYIVLYVLALVIAVAVPILQSGLLRFERLYLRVIRFEALYLSVV